MNYYREGEREKEAERDGELLRVQLSAARRYLKIFLYIFLNFCIKIQFYFLYNHDYYNITVVLSCFHADIPISQTFGTITPIATRNTDS